MPQLLNRGMQHGHSLFSCLINRLHQKWMVLFLEVLVVLAVFPVTTPSESLCLEKAVAEVAFLDHVGMTLVAVEIRAGGGWLHHFLSIS